MAAGATVLKTRTRSAWFLILLAWAAAAALASCELLEPQHAGAASITIVDGFAPHLAQRSLMITVEVPQTYANSSNWYVNLTIDPDCTCSTTIDNSVFSGTGTRVPSTAEKVSSTRRRLYFPDTLSVGQHVMLLQLYEGLQYADSLSVTFFIDPLPTVAYSLSLLPGLGGADAVPAAENEAGDAAGWALDSSGRQRATLWHNGAVVALDTAPSTAVALNNSGDVFGTVTSPAPTCGVRWSAGAKSVLKFPDGSCFAVVIDANNSGTVFGRRAGESVGGELLRADGSVVVLPSTNSSPERFYFRDINDAEMAVGQQYNGRYVAASFGFQAAFPGRFPYGGSNSGSIVSKINNVGWFFGTSGLSVFGDTNGDKQWVGTVGGSFTLLSGALSINQRPTLTALNDSGTVLAFRVATQQGFLWRAGQTTQMAIDSPDWRIDALYAINNAGRIVGHAVNKLTGETRAILLDPK